MHKLIIEDDEGKTTVVPLIRDEITIGRKEGNTIRLTERNVSRRHARLAKTNGSVFIEDLQSFNGIKVNGDRIAGRAAINEGDRIQIGDYQLALKYDKNAPAPTGSGEAAAPHTAAPEETAHQVGNDAGATAVGPAPVLRAKPDAPTAANPVLQPGADPERAAVERPARLVVVSSNFAGREFKLEKPQLVIGRTSDSDLILDHRSISRQHARIFRESGRYHIEDLKSANGVRVNGEEYGKVELRKGDFIDLGHVRLRFVGPNEDFVFSRDAQVVDVEGSKKGKGVLVGVVVAAIVGLVAVVGVVKMLGSSKGETAKGGAEQEAQLTRLNVEVDRALKAEDWETATARAADALKLDASQAALRDKKARAEAEKKNQLAYDRYAGAAKVSNYEEAVSRYQEIPDTSVYREKASQTWPIIKSAYIKDHLAKARELQGASKCDEAKKHVESVLFIDDANAEAQDLAKKCGQVPPQPKPRPVVLAPVPRAVEHEHVAAPQRPAPVARPLAVEKPAPIERLAPPAPPEKPVVVAAAAGGGEDEEKLVKEALDDYVHGNYTTAIDKARRANHSGSNSKAWRVIGASSCFLKDKSGAVSAWNKLTVMDRKFLQYVCQRNSIALP